MTDVEIARRAVSLIDLTDLSDDSSDDRVGALCSRAARYGTAAVCIWPDFVVRAVADLSGHPVRVATVVNFPTGDERPFAAGVVTERAVADGADDIDVVLPYRRFADGDLTRAGAVLDVVRIASEGRALMKVILETGELADLDVVARASRFAIDHGADFIKTSTGMSPVSATIDATAAMLDVISKTDRRVGLKPAGGIRSLDDAQKYLSLADRVMGPGWASPATFRFGASGLLDALAAVVAGDSSATPSVEGY